MRKPVYKDICEDIRKKIVEKAYGNKGRLPSERQLSEEYSVNRITLRKALNILYNEGLIVKLGQKGTFISSEKPKTTSSQVKRIAYFHVGKDQSSLGAYHGAIMTAIQQELRKNHSSMLFYTIDSATEVQRYLTTDSLYQELDGIIIAGGVTPLILKQVKRFKLPIVLIGQLTRPDSIEDEIDQIAGDPSDYTTKAMKFLLEQNCQRIAFVDSPAFQWSIIAQQTYMQMLEDNGIEYREDLVIRCTQASMREAYELRDKIISLKVDGVFVRNDNVARGLYDGLIARGVVGGKDIKWVSIGHTGDNVEHLGVTRLVVDPKNIALTALETLLERLDNPKSKVIKKTILHRFRNKTFTE